MKEQRQHPRKNIKIPIIYSYNEKGRLKSRDGIQIVRNVSKGGLHFVDEYELKSGTHLVIKLNIIEETITCQGIVVRCEKKNSPAEYEIGIEFTKIREDDREKIYRFSEDIFG